MLGLSWSSCDAWVESAVRRGHINNNIKLSYGTLHYHGPPEFRYGGHRCIYLYYHNECEIGKLKMYCKGIPRPNVE